MLRSNSTAAVLAWRSRLHGELSPPLPLTVVFHFLRSHRRSTKYHDAAANAVAAIVEERV
jgi:hypothetical protein